MKIALISPNPSHLSTLSAALSAAGHSCVPVEGGKTRLAQVLSQVQPEVVLIDGMCGDLAELDLVEQATAAHPALSVVLLCAQQLPEFLLKAMRVGVREVLPSPASPELVLAALQRLDARLNGVRQPGRGQLLAFMPCKGGSGATFIAANLGYQLAQDKSVLLIDLNLQFGDALSLLHDQEAAFTLADVARELDRLDASLLEACTVRITPRLGVLAAPRDFGEAAEITPEHLESIIAQALRQHDFVLLDLPRSLDPLSIKAMDQADRLFMVLQPGLTGLRQAKRLQQLFRTLDYAQNKVQWIVNRYERSSDLDLDQLGRALGTDSLRTVANGYRDVRASINQGTALVQVARSSMVTRNLAELALSLEPRREDAPSLLERWFRRA